MAFDHLSEAAKGDLAVSLAVLALHDGGVDVSGENINAMLKAANVNIAGYWAPLFAKMLASRNLDDMLLKPGAGGAPAAGGAAAAPAAGGAAPAAGGKKKEEEKKEEEEEDAGGAGGLFGGDDDW